MGSSADDSITPSKIKDLMKRSGYIAIACSLALESPKRKSMIKFHDIEDGYNVYTVCGLTSKGLDWLLGNQSRFNMRRVGENPPSPIEDDDIPF